MREDVVRRRRRGQGGPVGRERRREGELEAVGAAVGRGIVEQVSFFFFLRRRRRALVLRVWELGLGVVSEAEDGGQARHCC